MPRTRSRPVTAYYNEFDPVAAAVLRQLIADGVIADGVVDERSIKEVKADDLRNFSQVHLFAGGGLWSVAARLAGWPDERPLWTASCPCQPFSQAGRGRGTADERHLWPDVARLINECRAAGFGPPVVVGEQVAGAAGYDWFNGVASDLEAEGYEAGAVDIPSCAVDAPHIRQRLYWVAVDDSISDGLQHEDQAIRARRQSFDNANGDSPLADADAGRRAGRAQDAERGEVGRAAAERVDDLEHTPRERRGEGRSEPELRGGRPAAASADAPISGVTLGDAFEPGLEGQSWHDDGEGGWALADRPVAETDGSDVGNAAGSGRQQGQGRPEATRHGDQSAATHCRSGSFWSDHEWLVCHDGKARRTKSRLCHVVDGISARVDSICRSRGYSDEDAEAIRAVMSPELLVPSMPGRVDLWKITGNAINPQLAARVLAALMEVKHDYR